MIVYDGHCHVASTRFIPPEFIGDVAANMTARFAAKGVAAASEPLIRVLTSQHQDHVADRLVAEMDAAGVARAVLLVPDFGFRMTCPLPPTDIARCHHEIRLRHPGRFWVYWGVDPRRGDEGLRHLEFVLGAYRFEGLKLYPPCGYSPSDQRLYPYYEICAAQSLPVFIHTGPSARSLDNDLAHPRHADRAARDFPAVNFVLGHAGLSHVAVATTLASARPNVYLDIGGFASAPALASWPEHLNQLFRLGINHKIIFGTDWPLGGAMGGLRRILREVRRGQTVFAEVPEREKSLLLRENLLRVLPARSRQG
jgi:uncharacterized protein